MSLLHTILSAQLPHPAKHLKLRAVSPTSAVSSDKLDLFLRVQTYMRSNCTPPAALKAMCAGGAISSSAK